MSFPEDYWCSQFGCRVDNAEYTAEQSGVLHHRTLQAWNEIDGFCHWSKEWSLLRAGTWFCGPWQQTLLIVSDRNEKSWRTTFFKLFLLRKWNKMPSVDFCALHCCCSVSAGGSKNPPEEELKNNHMGSSRKKMYHHHCQSIQICRNNRTPKSHQCLFTRSLAAKYSSFVRPKKEVVRMLTHPCALKNDTCIKYVSLHCVPFLKRLFMWHSRARHVPCDFSVSVGAWCCALPLI